MPTTWYFDGAGGSADCRIMVLSGVGGSDGVWTAFDEAWNAALRELGIETWHSTEYFRRRSREVKRDVPVTFLNLIGKQVSQQFSAVSFAADKAAAAAARRKFPDAVPPVERMLMELCFGNLGVAKEDIDQAARVSVLFDQTEPFIRHLKSPWQTGRTELRRAKEKGWPTQIRGIEPAKSEDHPGLQAAAFVGHPVPAHRRNPRPSSARKFKPPWPGFRHPGAPDFGTPLP